MNAMSAMNTPHLLMPCAVVTGRIESYLHVLLSIEVISGLVALGEKVSTRAHCRLRSRRNAVTSHLPGNYEL